MPKHCGNCWVTVYARRAIQPCLKRGPRSPITCLRKTGNQQHLVAPSYEPSAYMRMQRIPTQFCRSDRPRSHFQPTPASSKVLNASFRRSVPVAERQTRAGEPRSPLISRAERAAQRLGRLRPVRQPVQRPGAARLPGPANSGQAHRQAQRQDSHSRGRSCAAHPARSSLGRRPIARFPSTA